MEPVLKRAQFTGANFPRDLLKFLHKEIQEAGHTHAGVKVTLHEGEFHPFWLFPNL